jgi:hypothetical protein
MNVVATPSSRPPWTIRRLRVSTLQHRKPLQNQDTIFQDPGLELRTSHTLLVRKSAPLWPRACPKPAKFATLDYAFR